MRHLIYLGQIIALGLMFSFSSILVEGKALINSIYVQVFDPSGRPISQIEVELMNELFQTLRRQRTDSAGRAVFSGLSSGNFKVKVLSLGTNYLEQTQDATIINFVRDGRVSGSDNVYLDFHMRLDKRKINTNSNEITESIFVQEVPEEARKFYKKGISQLDKNQDSGLIEIENSIKVFPNYYDALDRLGTEYVQRKKYQDAVPYLIKAIDINQRSFSSFYALGIASFNLGQLREASEAFRAATIIKPKSINANLRYGMVLRIEGENDKAEKVLLFAKSLSKDNPVAEIHWQLGLLYYKLARNKKAADELETFLKIQPDSHNAERIRKLISQLRADK